ncbi:hypothetical protein C2S53_006451 [Perilla frutescens var. hirtella]|uniref:Myb/SANT-like domain-containing protein n=1 Tax=Perilla frutescens var. hirtella TaxID=608512 RepID=A0AAD4JF37_PERFH|nr:hypothetical protein C2S53_006451 [Perilla frutescens var. hirtella]
MTVHRYMLATPQAVEEGSEDRSWRYFQGCLGALDGTYIQMQVPALDKPRYRSRKGSATDGRVLKYAISRENGLKVPTGSYYLCDSGYTNGEGFLAPYRGYRYHLREWKAGHRVAQNYQEHFNMKHAKARNVIERIFGQLKSRWAILRNNMEYDPVLDDEEYIIQLEQVMAANNEENGEYIEVVEPSKAWSAFKEQLAQQILIHVEAMSSSHNNNFSRAPTSPPPPPPPPHVVSKERRTWTCAEDDALIVILKKLVVDGMRQENAFRTGYLERIEKELQVRFSGTDLTSTNAISKLTVWKRHYYSVLNMINTSGFGWNDSSNTISVEDDVWLQYIKVHPGVKSLRFKSFPYFKDWIEIFGKDRATGKNAQGPEDLAKDANEEPYIPHFDVDEFPLNHNVHFQGNFNSNHHEHVDNKFSREDVPIADDIVCDTPSRGECNSNSVNMKKGIMARKFHPLENAAGLTRHRRSQLLLISWMHSSNSKMNPLVFWSTNSINGVKIQPTINLKLLTKQNSFLKH